MFGTGFGFVNPSRLVDNHNSAAGDAAAELKQNKLDTKATQHALYSMREAALGIVLMLTDAITEDELGDELPSERLDNLMSETLGELDGEAAASEWLNNMLTAHIADAMESLGASEALITDAFGDDVEVADSALETIAETVLANLPADGDDISEWAKAFVFGEADDLEDEHNAATSKGKKKLRVGATTTKKDAKGNTLVYKAVKVIRDNKVKVINKRISGKPHRSQEQKTQLDNARKLAHTATAIRKAHKSIVLGVKMRLYKNGAALQKAAGTKMMNTGYK